MFCKDKNKTVPIDLSRDYRLLPSTDRSPLTGAKSEKSKIYRAPWVHPICNYRTDMEV